MSISGDMNSYPLGTPQSPETRQLEVGGDLAGGERDEAQREEHQPAQNRATNRPLLAVTAGAKPLLGRKQEETTGIKTPHCHTHRDQDQDQDRSRIS